MRRHARISWKESLAVHQRYEFSPTLPSAETTPMRSDARARFFRGKNYASMGGLARRLSA
jgi:hypothetical protein